MSGSDDELLAAIERLYSTFNRYPLRMTVDGCPHCVSSADNDCIHAAPLRKLTEKQLERYAFKAITTWGTIDDFRHFLPRIFELLATAPPDWIDPEVVFGKLPYGDFRAWPIAEQAAIQHFCRALWTAVSSTANHPFEIESCLCCIAMLHDDLRPFLDSWHPDESVGAAVQLAALIEDLWWAGHPWPAKRGWWQEQQTQAQQVIEWMASPDRLKELEAAFFAFSSDQTVAGILSEAFNNLYSFRNSIEQGSI